MRSEADVKHHYRGRQIMAYCVEKLEVVSSTRYEVVFFIL
jgi:hypothetical protein